VAPQADAMTTATVNSAHEIVRMYGLLKYAVNHNEHEAGQMGS
jgi:hypothetical protein